MLFFIYYLFINSKLKENKKNLKKKRKKGGTMSFPSPLYPPTSIFNWTGSDTPKSLSLSSLYSQKTASNGVLKVRALLYIRNRSCTLLSVGLDIGACYVLGIEDQEGSIGLTMWFFQIFPLILFLFLFHIFLIFF